MIFYLRIETWARWYAFIFGWCTGRGGGVKRLRTGAVLCFLILPPRPVCAASTKYGFLLSYLQATFIWMPTFVRTNHLELRICAYDATMPLGAWREGPYKREKIVFSYLRARYTHLKLDPHNTSAHFYRPWPWRRTTRSFPFLEGHSDLRVAPPKMPTFSLQAK